MKALNALPGLSWHRSALLRHTLSGSITSPRATILWLPVVLTRVKLAYRLGTLSSRSNRSRNWRRNRAQIDIGGDRLSSGFLVRAVPCNVSCLVASVAGFTRSIERATPGCSALLANMPEFAASIALHGLRLAVTSKVVGPTALVASSRPAGLEPTAGKSTLESATANGSATANTDGPWALTVALPCVSGLQENHTADLLNLTYSQVTRLVAVVATIRPGTAQPKSRAICLNMA